MKTNLKNLFGQPARRSTSSQRPAKQQPRLGLESLESRLPMAGDISIKLGGGSLALTGDAAANNIAIEQTAPGTFKLTGHNGEKFKYKGHDDTQGPILVTGVTKNITVDLKQGDDQVRISGLGIDQLLAKNVTVRTGGGADSLDLVGFSARKLSVNTGGGNDEVNVNGVAVDQLLANAGAGDDQFHILEASLTVRQKARLVGGAGHDAAHGAELLSDATLAKFKKPRYLSLEEGVADQVRRLNQIRHGDPVGPTQFINLGVTVKSTTGKLLDQAQVEVRFVGQGEILAVLASSQTNASGVAKFEKLPQTRVGESSSRHEIRATYKGATSGWITVEPDKKTVNVEIEPNGIDFSGTFGRGTGEQSYPLTLAWNRSTGMVTGSVVQTAGVVFLGKTVYSIETSAISGEWDGFVNQSGESANKVLLTATVTSSILLDEDGKEISRQTYNNQSGNPFYVQAVSPNVLHTSLGTYVRDAR